MKSANAATVEGQFELNSSRERGWRSSEARRAEKEYHKLVTSSVQRGFSRCSYELQQFAVLLVSLQWKADDWFV